MRWDRQMRFALPACKFEGLHLCHQFFHDLMSLLEASSLNVREEEMKVIAINFMKAFTPEYLEKLYKLLPRQMATLIQPKGPHINDS